MGMRRRYLILLPGLLAILGEVLFFGTDLPPLAGFLLFSYRLQRF